MTDTNPYLSLAHSNSEPGPSPAAGNAENPYLALVYQDVESELRQSMQKVAGSSADAEAKIQALAKQYGMPVEAVRLNQATVERRAAFDAIDYAGLPRRNLVTARFLSDPNRAAVAHDDVDNLSLLETTINSFKRGIPALKSMIPALRMTDQSAGLQQLDYVDRELAAGRTPDEGKLGVLASMYAGMDEAKRKGFRAQFAPVMQHNVVTAVDELLARQQEREAIPQPSVVAKTMGAKTFGKALSTIGSDPFRFIAGIGPESLVQSAPGLLAAVPASLAAGPAGAGAALGGNSFLTDYASSITDMMQAAGVDTSDKKAITAALADPAILSKVMEQASKHAAVVGTVDAISGGVASKVVLPGKLGTALAGKPLLRELANIGVQAPVQGAMGAVGEAGGELAAGQPLQPGQIMAEAFGEFFGTPGEVVSASARRFVETRQKASTAEQGAEVLDRINELAKASKLRERDPVSFGEFIKDATQDGPVKDIYIDASALQQSGAIDQVAAASPAVAAQLPEALASGGQVRIPVEEFASQIAGQDFAQSLIDHLKTDPNGFSRAEAQEFMQTQGEALRAEVEKTLKERDGDQAFKESRDRVQALVAQQLDSAKRFTPDTNSQYANLVANFYAVQGAKVGINPEEMAQRYPLRVVAENPAQPGQVLNQGMTEDEYIAKINPSGKREEFTQPMPQAAFADLLNGAQTQPRGEATTRDGKGIQIVSGGPVDGPVDGALYAIVDGQTVGYMAPEAGTVGLFVADEFKNQGIGEALSTAYRSRDPFAVAGSLSAAGERTARKAFRNLKARGILSQGEQAPRGTFNPDTNTIALLKAADLSTFLHEAGHFFLEVQADMASRPDAPESVKADMAASLKWMGVPDLATWQGYSLDEQRPYHEQWARGFEAYLFEGKSPNLEMSGVFQRFRAWLLNVYKSIKALNVELNDEIRGVFDRMLASTEQIKAAEAAREFGPMFTPEQAAEYGVDWQTYHELGTEATQDAISELETRSLRDMRWLSNARSRAVKALQREAAAKRKAVREEVTAEVEAMPVYQAQAAAKALRKEGATVDKDALAEAHGFTSADHLAKATEDAGPIKDTIDAITDQRMLERYGDLIDARAVQRAADQAVHNAARLKFSATELNALEKATGQRRTLTRAAKEFAENIVARNEVRHIRPAQYAAAEARASRAAAKALKAGKIDEAAQEKRNQLVQGYATRAAYNAQEEVAKALRYFNRFTESGTSSLSPDYKDQVDALLERYDLRKSTTNKEIAKRKSLKSWVESQQEMGIEPEIPEALLEGMERKSYKEMTLEELRGLVDTVKQIEHIGRLKQKLLTAKDQREFDEVVGGLIRSIEEHGGDQKVDNRTRANALGRVQRMFDGFLASHRKVASLAREMDGFKDGGPMWETLIRTMNTAGDREATMRADAAERLATLIKPVLKAGKMGGKGQFFPSIDQSLNREERIGIALNMGNAGNTQRLLDGEGWTRAQVQPVLDTLTKEDWQFVQSVWDFFESYRPEIGAKEKRVYGKEPEWVEPVPVQTAHGEFRGGYFPVKYDPRRSGKAEQHADAEAAKQQMRGAYVSATTRRSFAKSRADEVKGRPLLYSMDALWGGANEVIHDLSWHEWLIDANRILRAIDGTMRDRYGADVVSQFKNAVKDIAVGETPAADELERRMNHIRTGAMIAGLGFNMMNAAINVVGITQSMVRVGPRWVAQGIGEFAKNPAALVRQVHEKSKFMELRAQTMNREINEIQSRVQGKSEARVLLDRAMFMPMEITQLVVDTPTWWGAYQKALTEGNEDTRAVDLADQAVIDSQGGGQVKDLAAIQRGSAFKKLLTTFYGFFSTTYNLAAERTNATDFKDPKQVIKLGGDYLLLYSLPAVLGVILKDALTGGGDDWDDPEKLAKKLAGAQVSYLMASMVGVREVGAATQKALGVQEFNTAYAGPAGLRFFQELDKLGQQVGQGEADKAFLRSAINVAGITLHLPSGQVNRTIDGIAALAEGKTVNPLAPLVGAPPKN